MTSLLLLTVVFVLVDADGQRRLDRPQHALNDVDVRANLEATAVAVYQPGSEIVNEDADPSSFPTKRGAV